jgi:hypothetical protein
MFKDLYRWNVWTVTLAVCFVVLATACGSDAAEPAVLLPTPTS